jgi:F420-dependent oxidoreductase-like protein
MRLGIISGYSGKVIDLQLDKIKQAEALGYDSVWTAEAYGSDAVTPAAWILANTSRIRVGTAIMQMPARTPSCTAMTAMTLNQLSGGRFIIGLGASGPQVVEGWHGVAYGRPLTRTREYIEIIRKIMKRDGAVEHSGYHYNLPYAGDDASGLGKPLKSILEAAQDIPIYTASITPKGLECSAELADGVFPVWMNPERYDVFESSVEKGLNKAGKKLSDFDIAPFVTCVLGDDVDQCRMPARGMMALYIGGMGAKSKNFYNDYAQALGFEEAASKIQELYLAGKKTEAMMAVPNELIDAVALVGPKERIVERLQVWKQAGEQGHVGSMLIGSGQTEALELIANEIL